MTQLLRFISITACNFLLFIVVAAQSSHPLFIAVNNNDIQKVKSLLNVNADVTIVDDDSDNLLMSAALFSSPELMKLLLDKGVNVNYRNKSGETPIMWCTHDKEKLSLLLKYGADINAFANSGNTPLLIACVGVGQYEIIKMLLDNGADALARNKKKETALGRAAMYGDTASILLLLKTGIDINTKDAENSTALNNAIENSNRQVALKLLELGANPDVPMNLAPSLLCIAAMHGDPEIVNAILKKTKSQIGIQVSLMFAVYNEHDNVDIIRTLIENGANVNMKAPDGASILDWALKKGNTQTVELLRQAGAK